MSLKDIFKKEEKEQETIEKEEVVLDKKKTKKPEKKTIKTVKKEEVKKEISKKEEAKKEVKTALIDKKGIAFNSLKKPHITEKASGLAEENKYVFEVFDTTNKIEIAKAIESVYNVKVEKVRIINIHGKKKRFRKGFGWTQGMKKAIVSVKKGQSIEVVPK